MDTTQFALAPALAVTLLHSLWQVAAIAVSAWAVLAACSQRRAALRHAVGMGFLLAMVLVPAMTFQRLLAAPDTVFRSPWPSPMTAAVAIPVEPGIYVGESALLPALLSVLWLVGVGLMLLRHFGGWRLLGTLDRQAWVALPAEWQQRVEALRDALQIRRRISVQVASGIAAPFTARLLRPVVWLPQKLLATLPTAQFEALIAHELAHVARLDWLWNGLQCLVESLLFFHPAAWWLSRRIRQEREHACDDLAVAACGGDAIPLAEALAGLADQRQPASRLVLAAQGGSLLQRITRLLAGDARAARWRWPLALIIAVASGSLLAVQAGVTRLTVPQISIRTTAEGRLQPGDMREISARGIDRDRYYRATVDAEGRLTELYREDGQSKAIDAKARAWIERMSIIPEPPAPPTPPAPAELPAPPPPPAPPAPPELSALPAVQNLIALVAADPEIAAQIGAPFALAGDAIDGHLNLSDDDGEAELEFTLHGPLGGVEVEVEAERFDGRWTIAWLHSERVTR